MSMSEYRTPNAVAETKTYSEYGNLNLKDRTKTGLKLNKNQNHLKYQKPHQVPGIKSAAQIP